MKLKAGIAKVNITPFVGVELGGYGARINPSQGIYDDLFSKALILDDGEKRIAMITNDLLAFDHEFIVEVGELIQNQVGIDKENIMITVSHTHSGPVTSFGLQSTGRKDEDYVQILQKKIVGAVYMASRSAKEAKVGAGKGEVRDVSFNRRRCKKDIDPELGIIRVDDIDGNPMVLLTNYACHGVVLGPKNLFISADYPGAMQKFIEKAKGGMAMFTQGACGDIDPLVNCYAWGEGTFKNTEQMGTILGAEAIKIGKQIKTTSQARLEAKSKMIKLPTEKLPSLKEAQEMVDKYKRKLNKLNKKSHLIDRQTMRMNLDWAQRLVNIVKKDRDKNGIMAEIQILSINETVLVGISGEVFMEIGLDIKKESGFKNTFIISYANGCVGYIPTEEAFREGGYEPKEAFKWYGYPFPFAPNVEEKIKKTVSDLIKTLKQE